jgi:hypothetical protein
MLLMFMFLPCYSLFPDLRQIFILHVHFSEIWRLGIAWAGVCFRSSMLEE